MCFQFSSSAINSINDLYLTDHDKIFISAIHMYVATNIHVQIMLEL